MADTDKTIILTGGTRGLGLAAARVLARDPRNHVVITGRDAARTAEAAARVGAHGLVLDLGSLASIDRFSTTLRADLRAGRRPPLHVVVGNAGLQVYRGERTAEGFELTFGANHLGHVALIEALLDDVRAPGRIVLTSSGTHDPETRTFAPPPLPIDARALAFATIAVDGDSDLRDGVRRYATSKLANVMTAYELARRLSGRGITVNAFDPGMMPGTGLAREGPAWLRFGWATITRLVLLLPRAHTPATSGADLAYLATSPEVDGVTASYFVRRRAVPSSRDSYDEALQGALYADSLALLAEARAGTARPAG